MSALFPTFGSRSWVFGVLNVTPDSFSDGGRWDHTDTAVEHGLELARQGGVALAQQDGFAAIHGSPVAPDPSA